MDFLCCEMVTCYKLYHSQRNEKMCTYPCLGSDAVERSSIGVLGMEVVKKGGQAVDDLLCTPIENDLIFLIY